MSLPRDAPKLVIMPIARNFHVRERLKTAPPMVLEAQRELISLPLDVLIASLKLVSDRPWNWPDGDMCWWADLLDCLESHLVAIVAENGVGKTPLVNLPPQQAQNATDILLFISSLLDHCANSRILNQFMPAIDLLQTSNLRVLVAATRVLSKIDTCDDFCEAVRLDSASEMLYRWCLLLPLQFETDPQRLLRYYEGSALADADTASAGEPACAADAVEAAWLLDARTNAETRHLLVHLQGYSLAVAGMHLNARDVEKHVLRFQPSLYLQSMAVLDPAILLTAADGTERGDDGIRTLRMLALHVFVSTCFRGNCEDVRRNVARRTGNLGILSYLPHFSTQIESRQPFDDEFVAQLFRAVACTLGSGVVSGGLAPMLLDFIDVSRDAYPRACTAAVKLLNALLADAGDTAHTLNDFEAAAALAKWVRDLAARPVLAEQSVAGADCRGLVRALLALACSMLANKHSRAVSEFLNESMLSECVQLVLRHLSPALSAQALTVMMRLIRRDNGAAATIAEREDAARLFDACIALMHAAPKHTESVLQFVIAMGTSPHAREGGHDGLGLVMRVFRAIPALQLHGADVHLSNIGYTLDVCFTTAGEPREAALVLEAVIIAAVDVLNHAAGVEDGSGRLTDRFVACDHIHAWDAANHESAMVEQVVHMLSRAVENPAIAVALAEFMVVSGKNALLELVTHPQLPYYFSYKRGDDISYLFSSLYSACRSKDSLRHGLANELLEATRAQVVVVEAVADSLQDHFVAEVVRGDVIPERLKHMVSLTTMLCVMCAVLYPDENASHSHTSPSWSAAAAEFLTTHVTFLAKVLRFTLQEQAYALVDVEADLAVSTRAVSKPPRGFVPGDAEFVQYDDWVNCVLAEPPHRRAVAHRVRAVRFSLWLVERGFNQLMVSVLRSTVLRENYCHNSVHMCTDVVKIVTETLAVPFSPATQDPVVDRFVIWRLAKLARRVFDHTHAALVLPIKLFVNSGGVGKLMALLLYALKLPKTGLCIPRIICEGAEPLDMIASTQIAIGECFDLLLTKLSMPRGTFGMRGSVFSEDEFATCNYITTKSVLFEMLAHIGCALSDHGELLFAELEPAAFDAVFVQLFTKAVAVPFPTLREGASGSEKVMYFSGERFYSLAEIMDMIMKGLHDRPMSEVTTLVEQAMTTAVSHDLWTLARAAGIEVPQRPEEPTDPHWPSAVRRELLSTLQDYEHLELLEQSAGHMIKTIKTRPELRPQMAALYFALYEHDAEYMTQHVLELLVEGVADAPYAMPFIATVIHHTWRLENDPSPIHDDQWLPLFARVNEMLCGLGSYLCEGCGSVFEVPDDQVAAAASMMETLIACRFDLFQATWSNYDDDLELDGDWQSDLLVPRALELFTPQTSLSIMRLALVLCMHSEGLAYEAFENGFMQRAVQLALAQDGSLLGKQMELVALLLLRSVVEMLPTLERLMTAWLDAMLVPIARSADDPGLIHAFDVLSGRNPFIFDDERHRILTIDDPALDLEPTGRRDSDGSAKVFLKRSLGQLVDYINVLADQNGTCRAIKMPNFRRSRLLEDDEESQVPQMVEYLCAQLATAGSLSEAVDAAAAAFLASSKKVKIFNVSIDPQWGALKSRANALQFYVTALAEAVATSEVAHLALVAPAIKLKHEARPSPEIQLPAAPSENMYTFVSLLAYTAAPDAKTVPAHHVGESVATAVLELLFACSRISSESPVSINTLVLMNEYTRMVVRLAMNVLQHYFGVGRLSVSTAKLVDVRVDAAARKDMLLYMLLRLLNMMAEASNKHSEWAALSPAPVVMRQMVAMQLPQLVTTCVAKMDFSASAAPLVRGQYQQFMYHIATFDSRNYARLDSDEGISTAPSPASPPSSSSDSEDDDMIDDDMSAAEFVFQVQDIMDSDQMEQIVAGAVRDVSRRGSHISHRGSFASVGSVAMGSDSDSEAVLDVFEGSPETSADDSDEASDDSDGVWEDVVFEDVSGDGDSEDDSEDDDDDDDDDSEDDDTEEESEDDDSVGEDEIDNWDDLGMDDDDANYMISSQRQPFVSPALGLYEANAHTREDEEDFDDDMDPDLQPVNAADEWAADGAEQLPLADIATMSLSDQYQALDGPDVRPFSRFSMAAGIPKHPPLPINASSELPRLLDEVTDIDDKDEPLASVNEFPAWLRPAGEAGIHYPVYHFRDGRKIDQKAVDGALVHDSFSASTAELKHARRFFGEEFGSVMSDSAASTSWCNVIVPTGTSQRWATLHAMLGPLNGGFRPTSEMANLWELHLAVLSSCYVAMAHQGFKPKAVAENAGEGPLSAESTDSALARKIQAVAYQIVQQAVADTEPSVDALISAVASSSSLFSIADDSEDTESIAQMLIGLSMVPRQRALRANVPLGIAKAFPRLDAATAADIAACVAVVMLYPTLDEALAVESIAMLHDAYFRSQQLTWVGGSILVAPTPATDHWLRAPRRHYTPGVWNSVFTKQDLAGWLELVFLPFGRHDAVLELTPLVAQNPTVAQFLIQSLMELLGRLGRGRGELLQALATVIGNAQGTPGELHWAGARPSLRLALPDLMVEQTLTLIEHLDSGRAFRKLSVLPLDGRYLLTDLLECLGNRRLIDCGRQLDLLVAVIETIAERLPRHTSTPQPGQQTDAKPEAQPDAQPGAQPDATPLPGAPYTGRARLIEITQDTEKGASKNSEASVAAPTTETLPPAALETLVDVLATPECSPTLFQNILVVMVHLSQLPGVSAFLDEQLVARACKHRQRLVQQLAELRDAQTLQQVAMFMAPGSDQVYLLRYVTMLSLHFSESENANDTTRAVRTAAISRLLDRVDLQPLWADLDACLDSISKHSPGVSNALLLPLIETLMVATQRAESETVARACSEFAVKHRETLNGLVRDSPGLLRGAFSVLARDARILEYDNRREFFDQEIDRDIQASGYDQERINLEVGRDTVFKDSFDELFSLEPQLMRAAELNITFMGEYGVDEGGLSREWFTLLSKQIFDADYALFTPLTAARTVFHPNRLSSVNGRHLQYFEFVGRLLAKAIVDGQIMDAYFSRVVYKLLLDMPIGLEDMEVIDESYFRSLKWMLENDITDVIHETFSVVNDDFGNHEVVELVPNGANTDVSEANKAEYVQRIVQYTLVDSVKEQTASLVKGFYSILSKEKIALFDDKELEFLISGMPDIDLDDWRTNTVYTNYTDASPQIRWLWRAIESFDSEERARLLQFCTGTSKVPVSGFARLSSGKFTVEKEFGSTDRLPSAHTCNNVLCLPEYKDYESLRIALVKALEMGSGVFGFS